MKYSLVKDSSDIYAFTLSNEHIFETRTSILIRWCEYNFKNKLAQTVFIQVRTSFVPIANLFRLKLVQAVDCVIRINSFRHQLSCSSSLTNCPLMFTFCFSSPIGYVWNVVFLSHMRSETIGTQRERKKKKFISTYLSLYLFQIGSFRRALLSFWSINNDDLQQTIISFQLSALDSLGKQINKVGHSWSWLLASWWLMAL